MQLRSINNIDANNACCKRNPDNNHVQGCGIERVLLITRAVKFGPIQILDPINPKKDLTNIFKYAWSADGVVWTNYTDYHGYLDIAKNLEGDFYIRIRIMGPAPIIYINSEKITDYSLHIPSTCFDQSFCQSPNLWNPYANMDCAIGLQQQLADTVICMLGIPIFYFQVDPDKTTADYTFKEYVMHNVISMKQIKMMVEDGEMPSSNAELGEIDFAWMNAWQTEISKSQFATAFGDKVIPKARDFIYVPMMKRLWEVNAAYDEKNEGLLWRATTWKLQLLKYSNSTNFNPITDSFLADVIDTLTGPTYDDIFGYKEILEQDRQTSYDQIAQPKFAATNLYNIAIEDSIRKSITPSTDLIIKDTKICHHNTVLARNIYEFKNDNGCIIYQTKGLCGDSGFLSMIIQAPPIGTFSSNKGIAEFGPIYIEFAWNPDTNMYVLGIEELMVSIGHSQTYLIVYTWNRLNYTKELRAFPHMHRMDFPLYLLKPEQYWFDFDNENQSNSVIGAYNNCYDLNSDFLLSDSNGIQVYGWPLSITNIRYYHGSHWTYQEIIKESMKYTTDSEYCIFNDLARPINTNGSRPGFAVR